MTGIDRRLFGAKGWRSAYDVGRRQRSRRRRGFHPPHATSWRRLYECNAASTSFGFRCLRGRASIAALAATSSGMSHWLGRSPSLSRWRRSRGGSQESLDTLLVEVDCSQLALAAPRYRCSRRTLVARLTGYDERLLRHARMLEAKYWRLSQRIAVLARGRGRLT